MKRAQKGDVGRIVGVADDQLILILPSHMRADAGVPFYVQCTDVATAARSFEMDRDKVVRMTDIDFYEVIENPPAAKREQTIQVTLTGPAGSGKSTIARLLRQALMSHGAFQVEIQSYEISEPAATASLSPDNFRRRVAHVAAKTRVTIVERAWVPPTREEIAFNRETH